ncbi:MAG: hypothetical protein NT011_05310 [Kiritimatiellaeota bacterium]|nr:hypothetical protein [Kiritimatiellota bacterium]
MNSRERIISVMEGKETDVVPVELFFSTEAICGVSGIPPYKFLYQDVNYRTRAQLACVERFKPDSFILWAKGRTSNWIKNHDVEIKNNGEAYLIEKESGKKYKLGSNYHAQYRDSIPPREKPFIMHGEIEVIVNGQQFMTMDDKYPISSKEDIDRLFPLEQAASVKQRGFWDTLKLFKKQCDPGLYVEAGGVGSVFRLAVGILGLNSGFIMINENPELLKYLLNRMMEQEMEYLKVVKDYGADGIHTGEIWTGSDMISPQVYDEFSFPYQKELVAEAKHLGLMVKYYLTGNVVPRLEKLLEMDIDALHVEETFNIDIADVRKRVGNDIALVGNLDAINLLEKGLKEDIIKKVKHQIDVAGKDGRFITSTGSCVTMHTDPERIDLLINTSHGY